MTVLFTLDAERNVIPCDDPIAWAEWAAVWSNRHVATTFLDGAGKVLLRVGPGERVEPPASFCAEVSTVFVGVRSHPTQEPPHLFETTVFFEDTSRPHASHATWSDAMKGHLLVLASIELAALELAEERGGRP